MQEEFSPSMELFYCYAREDQLLRDQLSKHLTGLRRSGMITEWYDGEIIPGIAWQKEIEAHLKSAHIILLLISPDFIHSDYCYSKEMKQAIQRHNDETAHVIPILLRPVDWTDTPFSAIQMLPTNAKPVTIWPNTDEAFADVAHGIRRAIISLRDKLIAKNASTANETWHVKEYQHSYKKIFDDDLKTEYDAPSSLPYPIDLSIEDFLDMPEIIYSDKVPLKEAPKRSRYSSSTSDEGAEDRSKPISIDPILLEPRHSRYPSSTSDEGVDTVNRPTPLQKNRRRPSPTYTSNLPSKINVKQSSTASSKAKKTRISSIVAWGIPVLIGVLTGVLTVGFFIYCISQGWNLMIWVGMGCFSSSVVYLFMREGAISYMIVSISGAIIGGFMSSFFIPPQFLFLPSLAGAWISIFTFRFMLQRDNKKNK